MSEPLTDERLAELKNRVAFFSETDNEDILAIRALVAALQEARREVAKLRGVAIQSDGTRVDWYATWAAENVMRESAERTAADKSAECERLRMTVYAWLGTFRDEMPARQVTTLQDILGPLSPIFTAAEGTGKIIREGE